jgi:hypothetical protein
MGYTSGWHSRSELADYILKYLFESTNPFIKVTPIAHCFAGNNLWVVEETVQQLPNDCVDTWRTIVLFAIERHDGEWGYRDMTENMGPYQRSCPLAYLELAPLNKHHFADARNWREGVKAFWRAKAAGRELAKTMLDGQRFKANGREYVFHPWTPGYRVYKNYVLAERDGKIYRVKSAEVEPMPVVPEPVSA